MAVSAAAGFSGVVAGRFVVGSWDDIEWWWSGGVVGVEVGWWGEEVVAVVRVADADAEPLGIFLATVTVIAVVIIRCWIHSLQSIPFAIEWFDHLHEPLSSRQIGYYLYHL